MDDDFEEGIHTWVTEYEEEEVIAVKNLRWMYSPRIDRHFMFAEVFDNVYYADFE